MIEGLFNAKNISLALGSGSAKGVAHIGIIEAFLAKGYEIKAVSGSSIGAIIASYYALGKLDLFKEWVLSLDKKTTFSKIDFSIRGGLISGDKLMAVIKEHLGNATFEDCKIPLYTVATNLDMAREDVFDSGLIVDAIRASIAVPGVVKPFKCNGYYYVDGAVCNPVPVDVLYNRGYKNIVAVHLNEKVYERKTTSAPGIIANLSRSMTLVSKFLADAKIDKARVVITPELENIGMFDLYKAGDILVKGYASVEEQFVNGKLVDRQKSKFAMLRDIIKI